MDPSMDSIVVIVVVVVIMMVAIAIRIDGIELEQISTLT
jgi:hypothetical protein